MPNGEVVRSAFQRRYAMPKFAVRFVAVSSPHPVKPKESMLWDVAVAVVGIKLDTAIVATP